MRKTFIGSLDKLPVATWGDQYDRYWTPAYAVFELLKREKFNSCVVEPMCGAGYISRALQHWGYSVESSDIREPSLYGTGGVDFLKRIEKTCSIITNPPYGLMNRCLQKIVDLTIEKSTVLIKLSGLNTKGRFKIFSQIPVIRIYAFTPPLFGLILRNMNPWI